MKLPPPLGRDRTLKLLRERRSAVALKRERLEAEIVLGNSRFCWTTARRYLGHGVDLDDLFAEAQAALLVAVRRFDPRKSPHFAQYASRCMRRDLIACVHRQGAAIHVPRTEKRLPMGVSLDHMPDTVAERILGPAEDDPAAEALGRIEAAVLNRSINALPEREAVVVRLRFGLAGCAPHELAEIGTVLGISKQRTQAILAKALAILKGSMKEAA